MEKIFKQNLTSDLILKALLQLPLNSSARLLDLGCGDGNIGLRVALKLGMLKIFGSDISPDAVDMARAGAEKQGINSEYRIGSGYAPWSDKEPFDVICCDVAAISTVIASFSTWYDGVSCETGISGLDLVTPIIENTKSYLKAGGIFVIPVISLANHTRLISVLEDYFNLVEVRLKKEWPVPDFIIKLMSEQGYPLTCDNWEISKKFGIATAFTGVAICMHK